MIATLLLVSSVVALLVTSAMRHRIPRVRRRYADAAAPALLLLALLTTTESFVVQKWLGGLLMPMGLLWLGLLGVAVWLLRARRQREATVALVFFSATWLSGNTWLATACVSALESDYRRQPSLPKAPYDAVAVLGGGASSRPWGEPQLSPSGDRIATAARLYHRGHTKQIVCTGTSVRILPGGEPRDSARETATILSELGVPPDAIVRVTGPRNTSEEIARLTELFRERGWRRVGLVTSAWHMRRALRLAERAGLEIVPLAGDFRSGVPVFNIHELMPSAIGMYNTRLAAWELLGATVGR